MRQLVQLAVLAAGALALSLTSGAAWLDAHAAVAEDVIVTLKDGSAFEGRLVKKTNLQAVYDTVFGERTVPVITVVSETPSLSLRRDFEQRAAQMPKDDIGVQETLLKWCALKGLTSGVAVQLERVLREQPDRPAALEIVHEAAPHYRIGRRNPHEPGTGRWSREQIDLLWEAAEKADFAHAAFIRRQLQALPIDVQMTFITRFTERGTEPQRWIAAFVLGETKDVRRVQPLYKAAFRDTAWQVRGEAVRSLKRHDDGTTFRPFVRVLLQSPHAELRLAAAEALGHLGDNRAVAPLVYSMKAAADGTRPTYYNSGVTQVAYVKDYDVEVAQTAFIADPLVDIVQDGYVHVVSPVAISIVQKTYGRALSRLTGVDYGANGAAWAAWWKARRTEAEAAGATR